MTTVVYVLIQIVALGTLPGLATDETPLASASRVFLGSGGAALMTVGAILSTTGSNSAVMLVGPRILYAMGEGGQLPRVLARIHSRYLTPYVSVLLFALITWGLAVYGDFAQLVALSAIARLVFSVTTCLAVPVLRRKMSLDESKFRLPGGALIPVLAAVISLWLLSGINGSQALAGVAAVAVGALLWALFRRM